MKKLWKRVCSFLLVPVMLLSVIPPTAFAAAPEARASYFDFDASDYCVREGDNALTVKIVRRGDGAAPANVA
ncbi:MAG: hypothetical protein IJT31_07105, partial [Oscillibacter sp.]|nr:hypothetical protein [Oscillibacter sp.]